MCLAAHARILGTWFEPDLCFSFLNVRFFSAGVVIVTLRGLNTVDVAAVGSLMFKGGDVGLLRRAFH